MPLSGELQQARRTGGDALDSIDDELFSIDYRSPTQARHLTLLPEPPTVRLAQREAVNWPAPGPYAPVYAPAAGSASWVWTGYPASEYSGEENGIEIVLLVGIAVLLVVAVASTGVVLWWLV